MGIPAWCSNLTLFHVVFGVVITFLMVEVFWWALVLNRHARWMHTVAKEERRSCFADGWFRVYMASVMACAMSLIAFFWEAYILAVVVSGALPHMTYAPWIICGLQLSHVHLYSIVARCSCLDVAEWPWASRIKAQYLDLDNRIALH